ncbi:hypothetical protein C3L33_17551, partial [Rhododendron williamsianum]
MATAVLYYVQKLWPFSALNKFDDLKVSEGLVRKLSVPKHTKQFVFAIREPESDAVIYVLCAQNLSERSALDAECLIREVRPDAVVVQLGHGAVDEIQSGEIGCRNDVDISVPTSSFEVLKRCFVHKLNKDKYENVAGTVVLREIFGISLYGHFLAARRVAEEVGSSFLLLESPFVKCGGEENPACEGETGNKFQVLGLQPSTLVPQKVGSVVSSSSRRFCVTTDLHLQMLKPLCSFFTQASSVSEGNSDDLELRADYEAPPFARSFTLYLSASNQTMGNSNSDKTKFAELDVEEKSHALLAHALRSQTKNFKSIVAIVDASGLAGLRKHWNTSIPLEIKDMVEQLITDCENVEETSDHGNRKQLLTSKPVVAVGAGATAILGASSLSKAVPASTFMKVVTFKAPASLKLILTQTQKAVAIALSKTVGPSKVVAPGFASTGAKATSALKATASAQKIRAVAHSMIASAEKTSLSTMRTAFYEIMRKRRVKPIGFLPWATFGFSIATCTGLLVCGDGIECVAESLPAAPSIASLGRGIQSLHEASQAVRQAESSRIQKSIELLIDRFKKVKAQ